MSTVTVVRAAGGDVRCSAGPDRKRGTDSHRAEVNGTESGSGSVTVDETVPDMAEANRRPGVVAAVMSCSSRSLFTAVPVDPAATRLVCQSHPIPDCR